MSADAGPPRGRLGDFNPDLLDSFANTETKSRKPWIPDMIMRYLQLVGGTLFGTLGLAYAASAIGSHLVFLAIMCGIVSVAVLIFGCVLISIQLYKDDGKY